jgi:uracil-DNA glycosylase family 4
MGFFDAEKRKPVNPKLKGLSFDLLHSKECTICPLNNERGLHHPKMPAFGVKHPLVYILGEAPGADEDKQGRPFVGASGKLLRQYVPEKWLDKIRWNNVVRTRPPGNRDPSVVEVECCRPSVTRDIEQSKPKAIFGFGAVPLAWALNRTHITHWNGRRVPVRVGEHVCWYFPMVHPAYVLYSKNTKIDFEFTFANDLRRAFAAVPDLPEPYIDTPEDARQEIELVTGAKGSKDLDRVLDFLEALNDEPVVGIDYETNNFVRPYDPDTRILSVALAAESRAMGIALDHSGAGWLAYEREQLDKAFRQFLLKARCRKVSHNLAFELEWSAFFYGRKVVRSRWGDTLSQAYILDERQDCLGLDFLCLQHFGINIKALSSLDPKKLDRAPVERVLEYNAIDAKYHRDLYLAQAQRLEEQGLTRVYQTALRRVPTMVLTQLKGIPVDQKVVSDFNTEYTTRITEIETRIRETKAIASYRKLTGKEFRASAGVDVKLLMNEVLKLQVESVDEKVLGTVKHPVAKLILEHREYSKLLSTYVKCIMTGAPYMHADGLMHPLIQTTRTRTWRTSAAEPNEQNFPKHEHREVRSQIRPGGDLRVVSFDYGAIQARNVAMESLDPALIKAFKERYDIHADWRDRIVHLYPNWVSEGVKILTANKDKQKEYRNRAKNEFVFASFFGAQAKSVAGFLGVPVEIGERLHKDFWEMFPHIRDWHKRLAADYKKTGYVTSLSGFRRRAPVSANELINAPIQADESAIVCDAMARLSELDEPRFQANMMIHDDLTFFWPRHEIDKNSEVVLQHMLYTPFEWAHVVPIVVEMSVGTDWANQKSVGEYSSADWSGRSGYAGE